MSFQQVLPFARHKTQPGPVARIYAHGTRQRYQGNRRKAGCRCEPCSEANRQYSRDMRQIKKYRNREAY